MTLEQFFHAHPRAAVAFSGGTDSAFLLWAAKTYGCDVHAYYMKTAFQPASLTAFPWAINVSSPIFTVTDVCSYS